MFLSDMRDSARQRREGERMKTLGQLGYEAYGDHAKWQAFDGRPMPRWDDALRPDIKEKWEVAAREIATQAIADFLATACFQCRNPEYAGLCKCGKGKKL